MKTAVLLAPLAALACCATPPERIAAAPVPAGAYSNLDCKALEAEHLKVQQQLAAATTSQRHANTGDTIGVILLGIPVSSMTGNDRETDVAVYKGQADALGQERLRKGCLQG